MTTTGKIAKATNGEVPKKTIRERYNALHETPTEKLQEMLAQPQLRAADLKAIERIFRERQLPAPVYTGEVTDEKPLKTVIAPSQLSSMQGVVDKGNTKHWREIVSFVVGLVVAFVLWRGEPGISLICGIAACAAVFIAWGWVENKFQKDTEEN